MHTATRMCGALSVCFFTKDAFVLRQSTYPALLRAGLGAHQVATLVTASVVRLVTPHHTLVEEGSVVGDSAWSGLRTTVLLFVALNPSRAGDGFLPTTCTPVFANRL